MTDYSKIDFTQLKLEPIDSMKVDIELRACLSIAINGWIAVRRVENDWAVTSGSNGLVKRQIDELWKRTEQVDEFIKQRSRRRITLVEFAQELVDDEREITILCNGERVTYRFNRDICAFEYLPDGGEWTRSFGMGRRADIVTIID